MWLRIAPLLLVLAGCGGGGADDDNHGYGFEYDVQGVTGLRLRHSPAVTPGGTVAAVISEPTLYETAFAEVQACTGLSAPAPFVILVNELGGNTGFYLSNPSLILVDVRYIGPFDTRALKHEMVHYLLDHSTGHLDPNHDSPAFELCS
jgi:hypothetical protein